MIVQGVTLAQAITEREPPVHVHISRGNKPKITFRGCMSATFQLASGKRTTVRTCTHEQFRHFLSTCLERAEDLDIEDIIEIKAVLG